MVAVPLIFSAFALAFGVLTFWILPARRGRIVGVNPVTFLCRNPSADDLLIRIPLVIANSGPVAAIVADLRGHISGTGVDADLEWMLERTGLETDDHGFKDWASPLNVSGHGTARHIVEFGTSLLLPTKLISSERYDIVIEGYVGYANARPKWCWQTLIEFGILGPPDDSRQWTTMYETIERHMPDGDVKLPEGSD